MKALLLSLLASLALPVLAQSAEPILIEIKEHRFHPAQLVVPAGKRFKIQVKNHGPGFEEFESRSLIIEKFIAPGKTLTLTLGPLKPGNYDFFGEFHLATAQGMMEAK
jgi:hypothetical protein